LAVQLGPGQRAGVALRQTLLVVADKRWQACRVYGFCVAKHLLRMVHLRTHAALCGVGDCKSK
jgi:hypothetical protein